MEVPMGRTSREITTNLTAQIAEVGGIIMAHMQIHGTSRSSFRVWIRDDSYNICRYDAFVLQALGILLGCDTS